MGGESLILVFLKSNQQFNSHNSTIFFAFSLPQDQASGLTETSS